MKAMILAAGFGTRLGTLTQETPKCLMRVGERVILDYVVEHLRDVGVSSIVVNLHYLAEKVRAHFATRGNYGLEVHFSEEPTILGTGGGILNARPYLKDEDLFLVHNADVYTELDMRACIARHREEGNVATLAVMERETKRPLLFDADRQLIGWQAGSGNVTRLRPSGVENRRGFSGVHVISKRLWPYFEGFSGEFSIVSVFMEAAKEAPVRSFEMGDVTWIDIGTLTELERLRTHLLGHSGPRQNG